MISFPVIPPAWSNPQRYTKVFVISPHNSAGMVIIMWCQIVMLSPAPNDMSAQGELELFSDGWTREIVWHSKIAETQGNHGVRAEPDKSMYHFY